MKADPHRHARRVVVDTNVWISAFLTRTGAPAQIVRCVLDKRVPVFSEATFAELETRLWRPKFDRYVSMEDRKRLLRALDAAADWISIPSTIGLRTYCRDADDDKFIHTALAANAPLLITGDSDLLDVAAIEHLRILTPAQALLEWM
jgi:putative PIN family toxin of toxin-antitoxin system